MDRTALARAMFLEYGGTPETWGTLTPSPRNGWLAKADTILGHLPATEFVTEVIVMPAGKTMADWDGDEVSDFAIKVQWRGPRAENGRGGYAVTHRGFRHLSRAGEWAIEPAPFRQHQYRWATLDEALAAARDAVDQVTINGMTYAQWAEHWAALQ